MAVITAVVVDPAERGMGVGEALVVAFVERARASGAPEAQLTTLSGRDGAGAFYEALGWERVGEHTTRDGARRSTYRLALAEAGRPLVASPLAGPDQERRATRAERNDSR